MLLFPILAVYPNRRYIPTLSISISDRSGLGMLDGVSLDQLRSFLAAVDEGSFSAAARKLRRAQSAVSELVSTLEDQIGVTLFDRSGRYPKLTPEGAVLLADARGIVAGVDFMKARAKGIAAGLEPELSVVVDVFLPLAAITEAAKEFREHFPGVPLRLFVEALGGAYKPVLDRFAKSWCGRIAADHAGLALRRAVDRIGIRGGRGPQPSAGLGQGHHCKV